MPYLGLGVYKAEDGHEVINSVTNALKVGYRHVDTASLYGNEKGVGTAVRESGLKREEVFVTSKLWNSDHGYDAALKAFDLSLKKLGFDYLDLYLIHWPKDESRETWKAFEFLYKQGVVKAIGVSNFLKYQLEDLLQSAEIIPMVNQMEFHPYLVQQDLMDYCHRHKIQYEAWSPLMLGRILSDKTLMQLAQKYHKDVAQLVLRWDLQRGVVTIPKSTRSERILSNSQIFDFEISEEDMNKINNLDKSLRSGADPANFDF
jgi:diketogulonate reductase-like aldo/keto reductase